MNQQHLSNIKVVALDSRLKFYKGMAYGLEHPTLLVRVLVKKFPTSALENLVDVMNRFVTEVYAESEADENDDFQMLVARIHFFYSAVQRLHNIPVYGPCAVAQEGISVDGQDIQFYSLALPYSNREASILVLEWVLVACNYLLTPGEPSESDIERIEENFEKLANRLLVIGLRSTNPIHFLEAAHRLDLPATTLARGVFAFGIGAQSRWLNSTITDATNGIGVRLAKNKKDTAAYLAKCCLPTPHHELVDSEEQAVEAAQRLAYPVVIKPSDRDQGRGVFAGLRSDKSLRTAYREARQYSESILVEKHYQGEDYRFTVMHDRVIKVMHRKPGRVIGNGRSTISELVEKAQTSPEERRAFHRTGKCRLELDDEARGLLEEQQLDRESIPAVDQVVVLRRKSNISTGGTHSNLPVGEVHPDNCALAVRAAESLGLDLAGVDIIMPDAGRSWLETSAVICEINAQPQIGRRDTPDIYLEILRQLLPGGGRIPIHLLVVDELANKSSFTLYEAIAGDLGCNGVSCRQGVWIDGVQRVWKPQNSYAAAQALLLDKGVHAGLMVMRFDDLSAFGIPVTRLASFRVVSGQSGPGVSRPFNDEVIAALESYAGHPVKSGNDIGTDIGLRDKYGILELEEVLNTPPRESE